MARPLTPSESEALTRCGGLLRFAAENTKDLPQTIVATISSAWDARDADTWDQEIATEFWLAFNSLCTLIKPVTMDTLSTNLREIPPPKWKFWQKTAQPISLARRSARRYLILLLFLLCIAVILGFLVSTTTHLSSEIQKLIESGNQLTEKMVSEVDSLEPLIGQNNLSEAGADQQKVVALLQNQVQEQNYLLDQMLEKNRFMSSLASFGFSAAGFERGSLQPVNSIQELRDAVRNYYDVRRYVASYVLQASLSIGVISSSILPIILGLMGACAYVIRLISDQIKDTTFSTTSPIRHVVRVVLGGLAGVVIGFVGIANVGSLSPSALAFIAGYAVEPVFSTFDGIAEKFRR